MVVDAPAGIDGAVNPAPKRMVSSVAVALREQARAGMVSASDRHRFRFVRIFPFTPGRRDRLKSEQWWIAFSAARLTRGVPWLCVPPSRGGCHSRQLMIDNSRRRINEVNPIHHIENREQPRIVPLRRLLRQRPPLVS